MTTSNAQDTASAIALFRDGPDQPFVVSNIDFSKPVITVRTEEHGVLTLDPAQFDISASTDSFVLVDDERRVEIEFLDRTDTADHRSGAAGGVALSALLLATNAAAAAGAGAVAMNHARSNRWRLLAARNFAGLYDALEAQARTFTRPSFWRPGNLLQLVGAALVMLLVPFVTFAITAALVLLGMSMPAVSVASSFNEGSTVRAVLQAPLVAALGLAFTAGLSLGSLAAIRQLLSWTWAQVWFNPAEMVRTLSGELDNQAQNLFFMLRPRVALLVTPPMVAVTLAAEIGKGPDSGLENTWSIIGPSAFFVAWGAILVAAIWVVVRDRPWQPGPSWFNQTYRTDQNSLRQWENGREYLGIWVLTSIVMIMVGLTMA